MKIGDLVEIKEGYHSIENHNSPPPIGKIALIVGKQTRSFPRGCVYTILVGNQRWSNVYGSRLKLIKEKR